MKPDSHPAYGPVVFEDVSIGERWLGASSIKTDRTVVWEDGTTYPLFSIEISNLTHPFFTGQMKIVDTAGRVDRFNKRYGTRKAPKA
jgi:large subunit ribosomal protein L31